MGRIAECAVDLITYRLDRPMGGSGVSEVDVLIAELKDDDGAIGFGFSYVIAGGGAPLAPLCRTMADRFLVGKPVKAPQAAWRAIAKSFNRTGSGWNMLALAALDVALWDLTAKRAGEPLGVAMGGAPRAVPVYASGPFQPGMASAAAVDAALAAVETGFRGVKPRVGAVPEDDAMIAAVTGALPADRSVMLDVNEKGDLARARRLLEVARDHGVLFVEEPLPVSDLGGFRRLANGSAVTIATGEHLQTLSAFEPYVADRLAGILQPDLAMIGGLTPALALAGVAAFHGLGVAPHFLPGLFVHLAAAAPAVTWLEDFALLEPLFDGMPAMAADGTMTIDAGTSGHGLSLSDRARAARLKRPFS